MKRWCASSLMLLFVWTAAPAAEKPLAQPWDYAAAMKKVAAKSHGRPGVVLHVGDSITYANPYGQWARAGEGQTDEDKAILKWMHAGADDDTDGWYLARFDHPDGGRSYTACGGIRIDEMLAGGKNKMPPLNDILDDLQAAGRRPHARHQRRLGRPNRRRLPGRHGEGRRSDPRPGGRLHPVHHPAAHRQAGTGRNPTMTSCESWRRTAACR